VDTPRPFQDLTDSIAFVERHFSSTPSASDAFAQAAVRTAEWAKRQASKVQLSEVISGWSAPSSLKPPWPVPDFPSPFGLERGADAGRAAKDRAGKVCLRAGWAGAAPRARVAVVAPLTFWAPRQARHKNDSHGGNTPKGRAAEAAKDSGSSTLRK
jgi:hypothetical protein